MWFPGISSENTRRIRPRPGKLQEARNRRRHICRSPSHRPRHNCSSGSVADGVVVAQWRVAAGHVAAGHVVVTRPNGEHRSGGDAGLMTRTAFEAWFIMYRFYGESPSVRGAWDGPLRAYSAKICWVRTPSHWPSIWLLTGLANSIILGPFMPDRGAGLSMTTVRRQTINIFKHTPL